MDRRCKPYGFHTGCLAIAATFVFFFPASIHSAAGSELRRTYSATPFLSSAAEVDPLGLQDPFASLSDREKSRWTGTKEDAGVEAKLRKLRALEITVAVDGKLVGFDSDGHSSINIKQVRTCFTCLLLLHLEYPVANASRGISSVFFHKYHLHQPLQMPLRDAPFVVCRILVLPSMSIRGVRIWADSIASAPSSSPVVAYSTDAALCP